MKKILVLLLLVVLLAGCAEETTPVEEVYEPPVEEVIDEPIEETEVDDNPVPWGRRAENWQLYLYEQYIETTAPGTPISADVIFTDFEIARLYIPDAQIDLIVIDGVDSYKTDDPAHFELTDFPSTRPSNTEIGAHRTDPAYFLFLNKLEPGDPIYLDIDGFRFTYEVLWQTITDQYDWSITNEKPDYPALTLTTCEPPHVDDAPDRLYVRAKLVEVAHIQ